MMNKQLLLSLLLLGIGNTIVNGDGTCDILKCHGDNVPCETGPADFSNHVKKNDGTALDMHTTTSMNGVHCVCPHGYTGVLCDRIYTSCDENHKCYNGGECIPGLTDFYGNDQLYCDCTNAKDETGLPYVGKFCEHAAAVQCGPEGVFCAHGGECPTTLEPNCQCTGEFFGPHCEYEGTAAVDDPITQGEEDSSEDEEDLLDGDLDDIDDDETLMEDDELDDDEVVPKCTLICHNGGTCILGGSDDTYGVHDLDHLYETVTSSASPQKEDFMSCLCMPGFGGKQCTVPKVQCGSTHHCYNGATCLTKQDSQNFTKHHCDCSTANAADPDHSYAGRFCQFKTDVFCTDSKDVNGKLYCVNGGKCSHSSSSTDGCQCPPGFYGHSCEFVLEPPPANFSTPQVVPVVPLDGIENPTPSEPMELPQTEIQNHNGEGEPLVLKPPPDTKECKLQCFNEGKCNHGVKELGAISHLSHVPGLGKTYNEDFEHCICKDGFVGLQCEHEIQICGPEGDDSSHHVCLYGSKCFPGEVEEYGCDCSASSFSSSGQQQQLAGTSCEHKSTHPGATMCSDVSPYPVGEGIAQPRNFCLNGGSCLGDYEDQNHHCMCEKEWVGPHCEIHKVLQKTAAERKQDSVEKFLEQEPVVIYENDSKTTAILAVGIIALLLSVVVSAYSFYRNREFQRQLIVDQAIQGVNRVPGRTMVQPPFRSASNRNLMPYRDNETPSSSRPPLLQQNLTHSQRNLMTNSQRNLVGHRPSSYNSSSVNLNAHRANSCSGSSASSSHNSDNDDEEVLVSLDMGPPIDEDGHELHNVEVV